MEWTDDPGLAWKYRDIVISKTDLVGLAKEYGLCLEERSGGQFSHRTPCPFHKGKNGGKERTPSFFISKETNSFCCFGCGVGGNPIEFVSLIEGIPAVFALKKLAVKLGVLNKDGVWDEMQLDSLKDFKPQFDPNKTIDPFLFEISIILRNHIHSYKGKQEFDKELKWIEKVSAKVDELVNNIGYEDWEYVRDMRDSVKKSIDKRRDKK
jgi:hypothetical protein